jgi:alpha-L-rhamnosidase
MDSSFLKLGCPKWISGGTKEAEKPAPFLERRFTLGSVPAHSILTLAVAGWHEVFVNGVRAGDEVLHPATCHPMRRLSSVSRDIAPLLRLGENVVAVLLGNGWFNYITREGADFAHAPWAAAPAICGALETPNGETIFVTDGSWTAYDSPIIFNAFRNGEWYDARKEGFRENERPAEVVKYPPFAEVSHDDAPPCRTFDPVVPIATIPHPDGGTIYDFGTNRAGWCEIEVAGEAGAKVTLDYDEALAQDGRFLGYATAFVRANGDPRPAQHDEYTLAGRPNGERWHPRFAYHGFRYAWVRTEGRVAVKTIRSIFVHSDIPSVGSIEIADPVFSRLQDATRRSYLSNFTGIPTDCPTREKNGWTGDAQLAVETGLWNFDARNGYVHFLRMIIDAQRPNGQLPSIVPCTETFGYGWSSGPAWDAALFEIPWQIFRFYRDDAPAREAYPAMIRYLGFILGMTRGDGLVEHGLGDWSAPEGVATAPVLLTDSAYLWQFLRRTAFWAGRFGDAATAARCRELAESLRGALNREFYKGDGIYAGGEPTSLAAPLFFEGLCQDGAESATAEALVKRVREDGHRARFGILGSKWIPRALALHGYIDDAWRIFTQPEAPGFAIWMQDGDTLWESFDDVGAGRGSRNHIMFGAISAWAFEFLAGIRIAEPGFAKVEIAPYLPDGVESFDISHRLPQGQIRVHAERQPGAAPTFSVNAPPDIEIVHQRK